ncbi:hypothetical protein AGMMS50268_32160 [Spirochaetia bacterium]|nr:hypothetical protein AGMMS50268_32160 [Spirochaetia bacterium]
MHYNIFTISYLEIISNNLNITINENGRGVFFPNSITIEKLTKLQIELNELWKTSNTPIEVISGKQDSSMQSILFGIVNDLEYAVKIGLLISDRVVLIDYLFQRILSKKSLTSINLEYFGSIASSLVTLLPLAKIGRVVIIPNPFEWNAVSKKIICEASMKEDISMETIQLLNVLSISDRCKANPYTIAESPYQYDKIINNQKSQFFPPYSYEGILSALFSERLFSNTEFLCVTEIPLLQYYNTIKEYEDFNVKYYTLIAKIPHLAEDAALDSLLKEIQDEINKRNSCFSKESIKKITIPLGVAGGIVTFLSKVIALSNPVSAVGPILAISSTLSNLIKTKEKQENPVINVFCKLANK